MHRQIGIRDLRLYKRNHFNLKSVYRIKGIICFRLNAHNPAGAVIPDHRCDLHRQ